MNVGILGCGYVANMYRLSLANHDELNLIGVFDRERCRSENMARITGTKSYACLDDMLANPAIECVLNLTNPLEHFVTSLQCLEAGKHVYSEKPLAMDLEEGAKLVAIAREKNLMLASAPCTFMSEVAQTTWKAIRDKAVGKIRLIYAEMEDGMVPRAPLKHWINEAGTAWPWVNEFETGCTVEHAGYVLTWITAIFGPAESVTAFSDVVLPDKVPGQQIAEAADFSVALVKFECGVILRMTNGIYARHDHGLRFFGDDGILTVEDPRTDKTRLFTQAYKTIRRKRFLSPWKRRLRPDKELGISRDAIYKGPQIRDFCRLISDMKSAVDDKRDPYLSGEFALHVTELTLACQNPGKLAAQGKMPYKMTTRFDQVEPLSWPK